MTDFLWRFILPGYLTTIAIETVVLLVGLSRPHPISRRLFVGAWLTACTYPIVVLVMPILLNAEEHRTLYLVVAETFAPVTECALFGLAFHYGRNISRSDRWRDYVAITLANLASFGIGEWLNDVGFFTRIGSP